MNDDAATYYFDLISPFSYIFDALLRREPLPLRLEYRPVLFAGLLEAHGNKGPAEIEPKRIFTYRYCTWLAEAHRIPFAMPAVHPFNPIRHLRLLLALGPSPERVSAAFGALWSSGRDPTDPDAWRAYCAALGADDRAIARLDQPEIKQALRDNTDHAARDGVFGVPTVVHRGELFWGVDALPMLRAFIADPAMFEREGMRRASDTRVGVVRRAS